MKFLQRILSTLASPFKWLRRKVTDGPEAASAFAAIIAIVVTTVGLIASIWIYRRSTTEQREVTSANLIVTLNEQWHSERMMALRSRFARELAKRPTEMPDDSDPLDFLENIGHLTKRGYLDEKMVWNLFVWDISCYYKALTRDPNLIQRERAKYHDKNMFIELEWLYHQFAIIEREMNSSEEKPSRLVEPEEADVNDFLLDESHRSNERRSRQRRVAESQLLIEIKALHDEMRILRQDLKSNKDKPGKGKAT